MDKSKYVTILGKRIELTRNNQPKEEFEDPYTRFVYLIAGSRDPQDDEERAFVEEIKEMRKKGIAPDLPFN